MRWRIVLLCLGTLLLAWGAAYLALAVFGEWQTGTIDSSLRRYGASRGSFYSVRYRFDVPGRGSYRGSALAATDHPLVGELEVRYLEPWPEINHPGSDGMLLLYAAIWILPGALLVGLNARRRNARGTDRRKTPS